jgi:hypothetical protein
MESVIITFLNMEKGVAKFTRCNNRRFWLFMGKYIYTTRTKHKRSELSQTIPLLERVYVNYTCPCCMLRIRFLCCLSDRGWIFIIIPLTVISICLEPTLLGRLDTIYLISSVCNACLSLMKKAYSGLRSH